MIALRILAIALGFALTAAALVPLRFALSLAYPAQAGLTHRDASGSIWSGDIHGASWRGANLGDLRVALQPLALATGATRIAFRANGPIASGVLAGGGTDWRFEKLNGRLALAQLSSSLPPEAAAFLTAASLTPSPTGCAAASGQVNVDGLPAPAPATLEGKLSCDAGDLVLSLAAPQGGGAVDVRIALSGGAGPHVTATSGDPAMQAVLDHLGLPAPPTPE